jgi:uncharacterized protein YodC (DUF2158 family)
MSDGGSMFKPGDVVQLKSGGPLMTVTAIDHSGVVCTWFDKNNHKTATFPASTLELYDENGAGGFGIA